MNKISVQKPLYENEIVQKIESLTSSENYVFYKKNILTLINRLPYELLVRIFECLEKTNLDQKVTDQELYSDLYRLIQLGAVNNSHFGNNQNLLIKPSYYNIIEGFIKKTRGNIGSFFISSLNDFDFLLPYRKGEVHGLCIDYELLGVEEVFSLLGNKNLSFDIDWEDFNNVKANSLNFFLGPWGDISLLSEKLQDYFGERILRNGIEWKAVRWLLDHTQEGGEVVALLPIGKLYSHAERHDRKFVLENYSIKLIGQLPEDFAKRSVVQVAMLVIKKDKSVDKFVPMIKLSKKNYEYWGESVLQYLHEGKESPYVEYIPCQEIAENQWNLSPRRYLHEKNKELQKFFKTTPADQLKAIRDVITGFELGRTEPNQRVASLIPFKSKGSSLPVLLTKDFNQKEDEVYLKLEALSRGADLQSVYKIVLDKPAVLYALTGSSHSKPLIFNGVGELYLGREIIALYPNELVSCEFLYYQLTTVFTKIQLEKYQKEGVFTRLAHKDFINIIINIGSGKEEQERILAEHFSFQHEAKEKKEKVRDEEFTIINALRHSLKQQLGAINNDISILHKFLENKETAGEKISLNEPISKRSSSSSRTLQDIFNRITGNYNTIQGSLKNMEKITILDKSSLNLTRVNLKDFIMEEFNKIDLQDIRIKLILEGQDVEADIDQTLFCEVIRNLVINSIKHGFANQPEVEHYVGFEVKKVKSEGFIEIEYWDSGKGFPEGFTLEDYTRYGTGSGTTKGTGLGGFILDRVVALHDGKLDLQMFEESNLKWISEEEFKVEKNMQIINPDGMSRLMKVTQIKGASPSMTEAYYSLIIRLPLH